MTQNITFEAWEAEQIRDPEFRTAVEELKPEYQRERSHMSSKINGITIVNDQNERITELEQRIRQLETCAMLNAEIIGHVEQLKVAMVEQGMRIEKLEAALETWMIAVNYTAATPPMSEMDVTAGKPVYSTPE